MTSQPQTYRQLTAAGEPFRMLFPLGIVFALVAVLLWPAFTWKILPTYPGVAHARIMIECFMSAFVMGFLGTALPRLLDVPRVHGHEASAYAVGLVVVCGLHIANLTFWGDLAFLITFVGFLCGLLLRARQRQDMPPPGFVLVILGLLSAAVGALLLLIGGSLPFQVGRLLLYQGFPLFPIMGVGAFLLPRFFQLPNRQTFPESLKPPPGWWPRALFALGCGVLVLVSFALEIAGQMTAAHVMRAAAVLIYFWKEVPAHNAKFNTGTLALTLRFALLAIPVGYVAVIFWPAHLVALLHVVFITGFGLLTLTVATRVIFGHCGQSHRFKATLPAVIAMAGLFVLALAFRLWGDFDLAHRFTLYAIGALGWSIALLIWSVGILPGIRLPDED